MAGPLVFVGLGPPIGFATLMASLMLRHGAIPLRDLEELAAIGLPLSYVVGFLPALAAYGAVRSIQTRELSHEGLWVAAAGAALGALTLVAVDIAAGLGLQDVSADPLTDFAAAGLVPALVCWHLSARPGKTTGAGAP